MATVKDFSVEEKLSSVVKLQKIDSKLDNLQVLKGELPIEVSDLEDEIEGLHARQNRIEEEINGMQQFKPRGHDRRRRGRDPQQPRRKCAR
jgi:predicted  nucleic acid-binding Zn-ribbon protein